MTPEEIEELAIEAIGENKYGMIENYFVHVWPKLTEDEQINEINGLKKTLWSVFHLRFLKKHDPEFYKKYRLLWA